MSLLGQIKAAKAQALAESRALRAQARADQQPLPPQTITGWVIEASCPNCDSHLQHVTTGRPGTDTRAIAGCPSCGRRWSVTASIRDATRDLGRQPRSRPHPDGCTCASHRTRSAA